MKSDTINEGIARYLAAQLVEAQRELPGFQAGMVEAVLDKVEALAGEIMRRGNPAAQVLAGYIGEDVRQARRYVREWRDYDAALFRGEAREA